MFKKRENMRYIFKVQFKIQTKSAVGDTQRHPSGQGTLSHTNCPHRRKKAFYNLLLKALSFVHHTNVLLP